MSKPLADIGRRLTPNLQKDALLKLLKQAAALLTEVEQSPSQGTVTSMKPCTEALVVPALLRHKDKDVRLLVATCLSEIMRIVAPEAPYEDDVLKDIFQLIVAIFQGLNDVSSPSFSRRVNILETVAKVRSCVVMLDLECDDLILEMFHVFFDTASEEHPQNVFVAMRNILALVIKESEEVSQALLEIILTNLLKDNKGVSPAAHKLAVAVVEKCADKLEPYVQKFLTSVMLEGKRAENELQEDYHAIIYEIYTCAPQMLLAVIPNLRQELVTDQIDIRLKAVELLGRLFALPGRHVAQEYRQLFSEFLKRFSDKAIEVRLAVIDCAKKCLEANPTGPEAADILAGFDDRLLDFDDKVRMSVVKCLCGLVNINAKWVPIDMIKRVAERLRDKKFSVREDTLHKLAEVYRTYTTKCNEGSSTADEQFEWIPGKIVRCLYDKDFRPQSIEIVFTDELFRADLPLEQRAKHWIALFSSFDKIDEKAFRNILGRKQRLQVEMQNYLGMREKSKKEDSSDLQKKIQASFKAIASSFADSSKAEENLQKVHQIKDNNIFKSLNVLLTPSTPFKQALSTRDELLKRIGEKHPQYDFIKILATKCSFLLFNKEHVKAVLKDLTINKQSGNKEYAAACLSLLVEFAGFFPPLMEGTEEDLLELLKDSDEAIKEGVVHVLAKAGGSIREQITEKESSVDLTLEQLCLEGNRKQAKHAVSAISAISADSGFKALSVLYGRLVDLLEDKLHLPTILQSLGCIAENAISVFETREEEVVRFVVRNLLKRENVQREGFKPSWERPSEECLLKIYGIKALVKSFLPLKDVQFRTPKLKGLLLVIAKLLVSGEVSDDIKSSDIDRAHLRLAAGKGVLRLARRWDTQILPAVVYSTLMLAQDSSIEVRQKFLAKTHQFLKERMLHQKYACVFALVAVDPSREIVIDGKRYLADFVESSRREARSKQVSVSAPIEVTTITQHPEYVLTYLVHVLAHQPLFPAEGSAAEFSAFEPIYKQLLAFLRVLLHQDGDGRSEAGKKEDVDNLPVILALFRTIKNAEDLVEKEKSENLYAVCDIGIVLTKELGKKKHFSGEYPSPIPLPAAFYKAIEVAEGEEAPQPKTDGSHLPSCFTGKDILTRFRTVGAGAKAGQPSSPRGSKRDRRTLDGYSSSDEGEKEEETDPLAKKSKPSEAADEAEGDAGGAEAGKDGEGEKNAAVPAAKQSSRVRRKANGDAQKNGIVKVADKESKKEEDAPSPKRKRGRPKGSGVKAAAAAGPSAAEDSAGTSARKQEALSSEKGKGRRAAEDKITAASNRKQSQDSREATVHDTGAKKNPGRGLKLTTPDPSKSDGQETTRLGSGREKRSAEAMRSPLGTPQRTPLKQVAVEKAVAARDSNEDLIGCRVKVWWPLDKRFYKGSVTGYNPKNKKHKILYDDNEIENLFLANEKWEITDSSKAVKKAAPEKPSVTPSSSNQSGKLKRKAAGQTVDNGSQISGPTDKKRAMAKGGKESNVQSPQRTGVGRGGIGQTKGAGSLVSPTSKNAKASQPAAVEADPFAFSDDERVGKRAKGASSEAPPSKGMTIRLKRHTEGPSKESGEKAKERPVEKLDAGRAKGRGDKYRRETESLKLKGEEKVVADGARMRGKIGLTKRRGGATSNSERTNGDKEKRWKRVGAQDVEGVKEKEVKPKEVKLKEKEEKAKTSGVAVGEASKAKGNGKSSKLKVVESEKPKKGDDGVGSKRTTHTEKSAAPGPASVASEKVKVKAKEAEKTKANEAEAGAGENQKEAEAEAEAETSVKTIETGKGERAEDSVEKKTGTEGTVEQEAEKEAKKETEKEAEKEAEKEVEKEAEAEAGGTEQQNSDTSDVVSKEKGKSKEDAATEVVVEKATAPAVNSNSEKPQEEKVEEKVKEDKTKEKETKDKESSKLLGDDGDILKKADTDGDTEVRKAVVDDKAAAAPVAAPEAETEAVAVAEAEASEATVPAPAKKAEVEPAKGKAASSEKAAVDVTEDAPKKLEEASVSKKEIEGEEQGKASKKDGAAGPKKVSAGTKKDGAAEPKKDSAAGLKKDGAAESKKTSAGTKKDEKVEASVKG